MDTLFKSSRTFASLSLKDLVDARDLFHFHLMNKKNVVATALGLYRIRKSDPWPNDETKGAKENQEAQKKKERRTLFNSEIRDYSWPCVYVFVSSWEYEEDLANSDPSDVVPKTLYLPDGRAVPVCVIEARPQPVSKDLKVMSPRGTPRAPYGPGTAILDEDGQGMARLATAGCIVRDGDRYYALTNRHAVGPVGTEIKALMPNRSPVIGYSSKKGLTRVDVRDVYPEFKSQGQRLLMDVGLVELTNILDWKTDIPGIAPVGSVLDLYANSLTLQLIGMKVVGRAAISGQVRGEIHGLLYRYKAMGGSEYLADFLIGPETDTKRTAEELTAAEPAGENARFAVHHGDSGALLLIEQKLHRLEKEAEIDQTVYHPFALLWGRQEFFVDDSELSQPYALATALSTALDQLDLDLVRDINADQSFIWGWVGHFAIGRALPVPTDLLADAGLKKFITNNLNKLALEPNQDLDNNARVQEEPGDDPHFVPLADVPDNVWKSNVNFTLKSVPGQKKKKRVLGPGNRGRADNPNHFADLDLEYKNNNTFLALNEADPDTYLNPKAWVAYFAKFKQTYDHWNDLLEKPHDSPSKHWGALPFRVHQLFDIMKRAANDGDADLFLVAGGVLIHYVGDACQPLHASFMSQGDPDRIVLGPRSGKPKLEADGVHVGYEDTMLNYGYTDPSVRFNETLADRIKELKNEGIRSIANGYDASKAIIDLIAATQRELTPSAIVKKWVALKGQKDRAEQMWEAFGDATITCMARGTRYLAALWAGAWQSGQSTIAPDHKATEKALMTLYNDASKAPSLALNRYPDDPQSDWSQVGSGGEDGDVDEDDDQ